MIDIGLYGPLSKTDRKTEINFTVKDFIFGHEPSMWSFDASDNFKKPPHVIDVTDDSTGEPHDNAKSNVCLYMNEIGHSKDLHQNVEAMEREGNVHYYLKVFKPMRKGDSIELLVDYLEGYERSRERKGYGRANLAGKIGGDNDECCRYDRNISVRKDMKELISNLSEANLSQTLHFIMDRIHFPINRSFDQIRHQMLPNVFNVYNVGVVYIRRLVAKCRIEWIIDLIRTRLGQLEKDEFSNKFIVSNLRKYVERQFPSLTMSASFDALNGAHHNRRIRDALMREISEEVLYQCSNLLMRPFDSSIWCKISQTLLRHVINLVAEWKWGGQSRLCDGRKELVKMILDEASKTAKMIRKICTEPVNHVEATVSALKFTFHSSYLSINIVDRWMKMNETTVSSELVASSLKEGIFDTPAHLSAAITSYLTSDTKKSTKRFRCCVKKHERNSIIMTRKEYQNKLLSISKIKSGNVDMIDVVSQIDSDWYLLWQVVPIIHAVASECAKSCGKDVPDDAIYSFRMLCDVVEVDFEKAEKVLLCLEESVGAYEKMRRDDVHERFQEEYALERDVPKQINRTHKQVYCETESEVKRKLPKWNGHKRKVFGDLWTCLVKMGWRLEFGTRPSDHYFMPPGVTRLQGHKFKNRVDFFDSRAQVTKFLTTNDKWNTREEIMPFLKEFKEEISK